jgi:peptide/nickel transport system substrate-binding protein
MFIWKKDPNYWNKAVMDPRPEYVVFRTAPTVDSEVQEFKRGQIDLASSTVDYTQAVAIKNSGYANIVIETKFRDPNPRAFAVNCDPARGVIADPKMHWALSYLVNRKLMADTVSGVPTIPAQYPWADYTSNDKWSDKTLAARYALTYDPARAETLLDELGAKKGSNGKRTYNGQPLQYEIITNTNQGQPEYIYGQNLADELTKVGIPSTIRYYSSSVFGGKFYTGLYDIAVWPVQGFVFDPISTYNVFEIQNTKPLGQDVSTLGNYSRAQFKDLDSVTRQLETTDPTSPQFTALADQALELFYKYLPFIPVYQQTYPTIFNTTYWTNWPTNDNLYTVPTNWWGQFLFVIGNIKPTGAS